MVPAHLCPLPCLGSAVRSQALAAVPLACPRVSMAAEVALPHEQTGLPLGWKVRLVLLGTSERRLPADKGGAVSLPALGRCSCRSPCGAGATSPAAPGQWYPAPVASPDADLESCPALHHPRTPELLFGASPRCLGTTEILMNKCQKVPVSSRGLGRDGERRARRGAGRWRKLRGMLSQGETCRCEPSAGGFQPSPVSPFLWPMPSSLHVPVRCRSSRTLKGWRLPAPHRFPLGLNEIAAHKKDAR